MIFLPKPFPAVIDGSRIFLKEVVVLMDGGRQDVGIIPEDLLGTIAVVHVPVNDGDPFIAEPLSVACRQSDIVQHAEVSTTVALRVMAGRPDEGEGIYRPLPPSPTPPPSYPTGRQQSDIEPSDGEDRPGPGDRRRSLILGLEGIQVFTSMHTKNFVIHCPARLDANQLLS